LTEQELREIARAKGKKLAFLIASLNVDNETKEAIMALLPGMSLEQIERFLDILESKYLQQETQGIDEDFKKELERVGDEHKKASFAIDKQALEKIKAMGKELNT
ncbi:MAG: hypothetical protein COY02_00790, partial [Parcubacteria group bacterium CG_4_10_14_0_2_um_filter_41_6]